MKKLFFVILISIIANQVLNSQTLFVENFNFPATDSLGATGGWYKIPVNGPYHSKVTSPGLNFPGYFGSGVGNSALLNNIPTGEFCVNLFTPQYSGKVYMSFLMRVDSLAPSATEGFCICLDEEGGSTNFNTEVHIKKINTSSFNLGIKKYDGQVKYATPVYNVNTTYLVVVNYCLYDDDEDDTAKLLSVSSAGVPASEPSVPLAYDNIGNDVFGIGEVILCNSYIQTGLYNCKIRIDAIKIGTTWESTVNGFFPSKLSLKAYLQGFYNGASNKMVKDTARVFLRYNSPPYAIADSSRAVLDSNGNGLFNFFRVGNQIKYFIAVKHRNSIETWSANPKEFFDNEADYNFTNSASTAFGSNLFQKGNKFCIYGGDVNQDGSVDLSDVSLIDNNSYNFAAGYLRTDANGDGITDISDLTIADNNAFNFVSMKRP